MAGVSEFPWSEDAFAGLVRDAVARYWRSRKGQLRRQARAGTSDAGSRGEVTGGRHLDAIAHLLIQVIKAADGDGLQIHADKPLALPGYYRAQKKWDIVVVRETRLLAAIELKSQSGSFGNNLNNRAEEVLGLSRDFWTAYRQKAFGLTPQPWLGYFFLLEDAAKSRAPVKLEASSFPADPVFAGASYLDRYRILCERLVLERDYTAAALVASPRGAIKGDCLVPSPELSPYAFAQSLFRHLRQCA